MPQFPMNILWLIWIFIAAFMMDYILVKGTINLAGRVWPYYFCAFIPLVLNIHTKTNFEKYLEAHPKKQVMKIYISSGIWIFLGIIFPLFFVDCKVATDSFPKEYVLIIFWLLSLPLTVIRNIKDWIIYSVLVIVVSLIYKQLVKFMILHYEITTLNYYFFTYGIVIISFLVSLFIFMHLFKKNIMGVR